MTTRIISKAKGVWSTVGSGLKQTHSSGQENHIQYGAVVFHTPATKHNHQQHTRAGHHSARLSISSLIEIAASCRLIHLFFVTL